MPPVYQPPMSSYPLQLPYPPPLQPPPSPSHMAQTTYIPQPPQSSYSPHTPYPYSFPSQENQTPHQTNIQQLLDRVKSLELQSSGFGYQGPTYSQICNEPIHPSVLVQQYSYWFELPKFKKFKGKEDPKEHLLNFKYSCRLFRGSDPLMLRMFPMSLKGQASDWFHNLPQHSLFSFEQLANLFLEHFSVNIKKNTSLFDLYSLQQFDNQICNEPIHPSVPVQQYPYPFELPKFKKFKGEEDPKEHLRNFKYSCDLVTVSDPLMLRMFPTFLRGQALDWFINLPQHSLFSFEQLANLFLTHYSFNIKKTSLSDLCSLRQFDDEALSDYVFRWRGVINDLTFSIPSDELARLFTKSCAKHISATLQFLRHHSLEKAIAQAKVIEEIKIRDMKKTKEKLNAK